MKKLLVSFLLCSSYFVFDCSAENNVSLSHCEAFVTNFQQKTNKEMYHRLSLQIKNLILRFENFNKNFASLDKKQIEGFVDIVLEKVSVKQIGDFSTLCNISKSITKHIDSKTTVSQSPTTDEIDIFYYALEEMFIDLSKYFPGIELCVHYYKESIDTVKLLIPLYVTSKDIKNLLNIIKNKTIVALLRSVQVNYANLFNPLPPALKVQFDALVLDMLAIFDTLNQIRS